MSPKPPIWTEHTVALSRLKPYERNPRLITKEAYDRLKKAIEQLGFHQRIICQPDFSVIGGHQRIKALQELGFKDIQVLVPDRQLTRDEFRQLLVQDNLPFGQHDFDILAADFDVDELKEWGMPESWLEGKVEEEPAAPPTEDETPEAPETPTSKRGDIWICGDHRIMCGDSTDEADVRKLLAGVTPEIANCDPPYGISVVKGGKIGGAKPFGRVQGPAKNAIIEPGTYAPIIGDDTTETATKCYEVLKAIGVKIIVLWGGNYYADKLPPSRCWLVWDKENTGTFADAELAWTNQDKVVKLLRHQWSGLIKASERGERRVHPTQKPAALADWVIKTLAPDAGAVLDLFLGGGWTLIAAEHAGKKCFGMELAPAYCDVAVMRWQNLTGKQAHHAETGVIFEESDGSTGSKASDVG